jgi:hypothetical protein
MTIKHNSLLETELIRWGKARRLIAPKNCPPNCPPNNPNQTIQSIAPIAACRLLASPRAYAHVKDNTNANTA